MKILRHLLPALALLGTLSGPALAQSNPGWTKGFVPSPGQWNTMWSSKQDTLGYTPLNTAGGVMSGRLVTTAPGASTAGFNMVPGTTPASPVNGDLWMTSAGLFARVNGSTLGPLSGPAASSFAATAPLTVAFPSGVTTYSIGTGGTLACSGGPPCLLGVNLASPNTWTAKQTFAGNFGVSGTTNGVVTVGVQPAAGTYNFNLPIAAGTAGAPLLSGGGGSAAQTYGTLGVNFGGTGGNAAGGQLLDNITGFFSTGFLTRTGPASYAFQSLTNGITNANLATAGAATFKGNPGATGPATVSDFTIQGLPARGTLDDNNDRVAVWNSASGALNWTTPGLLRSAGSPGVTSINLLTGPFSCSMPINCASNTIAYGLPYLRTRDYVRAVLPLTDGVCDGTTDVVTQINAAMAAAAGKGLLTEGKCALSDSAFVRAGTRVFGINNAADGFVMTSGSTSAVGLLQIYDVAGGITLDNLYFQGNAVPQSGFGAGAVLINVDASATSNVTDVAVQNSRFRGFNHSYYIWQVVSSQGATFTGTGSGTNLTVTAVSGTIVPRMVLTGTGVPAGTTIVSQTSGTTGGAGVYITSFATTSSGATLVAFGQNSIAQARYVNNQFDGLGVVQNNTGGKFIGIWGNLSAPGPTLLGTSTDTVVSGNTGQGYDVCGFVEVLYGAVRGVIANNVAFAMGNNVPATTTCYTFNIYASAPGINRPKNWAVANNVSVINHNNALYAAGTESLSSSGNVFTDTTTSATAPSLAHGGAISFNSCINCSSAGDVLVNNYGGIAVSQPDFDASVTTITNPTIYSTVAQSGVTAQFPYGLIWSGTSTTNETAALTISGGDIQVRGSGARGVAFQGSNAGRFKMSGAQVYSESFGYTEAAGYSGASREFSSNVWTGPLNAPYAVSFGGSSTPLSITNETVDFSKQVSGSGGGYRASGETRLMIRGLTLRNKNFGTAALDTTGSLGTISGVVFPDTVTTQVIAGSLGTFQPSFTAPANSWVQNLTASVVGVTPDAFWDRGWMNLSGSTTWVPDRTGKF